MSSSTGVKKNGIGYRRRPCRRTSRVLICIVVTSLSQCKVGIMKEVSTKQRCEKSCRYPRKMKSDAHTKRPHESATSAQQSHGELMYSLQIRRT